VPLLPFGGIGRYRLSKERNLFLSRYSAFVGSEVGQSMLSTPTISNEVPATEVGITQVL
jgi:hypothetical protein